MANIRREEFSARIEAMDSRIDARFETIDARFEAMDARIDARFKAMDARIDSVRVELGAAIVSVKSELRDDIHKLRTWVLSGVVASLASVLGLIGMNLSRDVRFQATPIAAVAPVIAAGHEAPVESPRRAGSPGDIPQEVPPEKENE